MPPEFPLFYIISWIPMNRILKLFTLFVLLFASCSKSTTTDETPTPPVDPVYPEILTFSLEEYPEADIEIDNNENKIYIVLPEGSTLGTATPIFTLSEGATSTPESGTAMDLSESQAIYLSAESGAARKYTVEASVAPASDASVTAMYMPDYYADAVQSGKTFTFTLPYGADVTAVTIEATAKDGVTFSPDISQPVDLSQPLTLTSTTADGKTSLQYTVKAVISEQEHAVRGVYLPSPSHTNSFLSYSKICESIDLLDELNFNCLFVCAWAQTKTAWDSDVLLANTNYSSASQGNMYASYSGGSGDALHDIIEVAHSKGIRVILWFEYGFMHGNGGVNMSDPLLAKHPDWIGINSKGEYSNYNGTDFYLNAYSPEVQEFMLSLMEEAIEKYPEVDGIQGDDRLPAMPRDSGYDDVTKALYYEDTGSYPPSNPEDSAWVEWRLDRLNGFARAMSERLRPKKEGLIVCFAPNKYPWCEGVLMQDWPQWIADGAVDLLTVQFYVTVSYEYDVKQALGYVEQNTSENILNPAMILKNGDSILMEQILVSELKYNRSVGTCGESQFWFEGLKTDHVQKVFKAFYPAKAIFPL